MHVHRQPWSLSSPVTFALTLAALLYWRGRRRFRIPRARAATFLCGLFTLWIALASPLVELDHRLLTFHMVKHLLLMAVAPPMLLLGLPARWCGRCSSNSVFCWLAATATVIGWHVPAAFQLALRSRGWHDVELASFLLAGLLFWWPVLHPSSNAAGPWSTPLYLFLATIPCDILSAFLTFCGRVVYTHYLAAPPLFHLSPLQDQEFAGALMWVAVTIIYLIPAIGITVQILTPQEVRV
jgi:putative membrane protein